MDGIGHYTEKSFGRNKEIKQLSMKEMILLANLDHFYLQSGKCSRLIAESTPVSALVQVHERQQLFESTIVRVSYFADVDCS